MFVCSRTYTQNKTDIARRHFSSQNTLLFPVAKAKIPLAFIIRTKVGRVITLHLWTHPAYPYYQLAYMLFSMLTYCNAKGPQ